MVPFTTPPYLLFISVEVEMKVSDFGVFVVLGDFYGDLQFAQQLQEKENCQRKDEEAKREAEEFTKLQVSS